MFRTIWPENVFFQTKWTINADELIILLHSVERAICTKIYKTFIGYFHKFSVQYHLHEHSFTFEQFCVVSSFFCVASIY